MKAINKLTQFLIYILVIGSFLWTFFYIVTYNKYYTGEPLSEMKLVIRESPVLRSNHESASYYYFTANNYKTEFRIEEGGKRFISDNKNSRERLLALQPGDTVHVRLRSSDTINLAKNERKIGVIGFSINNKLLIDPAIVKKNDRMQKIWMRCWHVIFFGLVAFLLIRERKRIRLNKMKGVESSSESSF